jgi:hypothetical protein
MGPFKPNYDAAAPDQALDQADLSTLLLQGEDIIGQLARAHQSWGLGSADRWDLDQTTGLIRWTFPDKTASALAQILASFSPASNSWMWAWANPSILPKMSRDARSLRQWGDAHGQQLFSRPKFDADEQTAATLVALAVRITRATGLYRGPAPNTYVIITFGPITLTNADGTTSSVTINID